jgi:hypothetical protein
MHPSVPFTSPTRVAGDTPSIFAIPKSASFTPPVQSTRTFAGDTSRCTIGAG